MDNYTFARIKYEKALANGNYHIPVWKACGKHQGGNSYNHDISNDFLPKRFNRTVKLSEAIGAVAGCFGTSAENKQETKNNNRKK